MTINHQKLSLQDDRDEEISDENALYEKGIQRYDGLAEIERSRRRRNHCNAIPANCDENPIERRCFVFIGNDEKSDPCKLGTDCTLCSTSKASELAIPESSNLPCPYFKFHEEDEDSIQNYIDEDGKGTGKRRSRTAEIALQKKASIRILSEMLHTLAFIEGYNNGFQSEIEDDEEEEENDDTEDYSDEADEDGSDLGNGDGSPIMKRKRIASVSLKSEGKKARVSVNEESKVEAFLPPFYPLAHQGHLERFAEFARHSRSFDRIQSKKDIAKVNEEILKILSTSTFLKKFCADDDVLAEEKAMTKGIRSYARKSEQEKMEKREFEEKRQYKLGLGLGIGLGKRRRSPEETELKEIMSRPFRCITPRGKMPSDLEVCPFGFECLICAPVLHAERPYEQDGTIYNPTFRIMVDNAYARDLIENEKIGKRGGNGRAQRELQQNASTLMLSELFHTFQFIENYNQGMIESGDK
jgi:hypothetical protein